MSHFSLLNKVETSLSNDLREAASYVLKTAGFSEGNKGDGQTYFEKVPAISPDKSIGGVSSVPIPAFRGELYKIGDKDYDLHRYQYAYSSMAAGQMAPSFVLYPAGDDDVLAAVNYAKEIGVAIAVRTGGHQYSGASSTNGNNFQLDMSGTYTDFEVQEDGMVYTGISHALMDFTAMMFEKGLFIPTGQCRHVHVGGHVQTGGYGQLGRAFGLFGDYVEKVRFITDSDEGAKVRVVARNASNPEERNLFWAVMGGSPGNYGVLTHLWIKPLKAEDYPNSRGLKGLYRYSKAKLQAILDFMVDMQCDPNTPRNFDLCVSVLTNTVLVLPYIFGDDIDQQIKKQDPEFWGKDGIGEAWPAVIIVYAQYVNIPGEPEPNHEKFFKDIKNACGWPIIPYPIDNTTPTVMTKILPNWLFPNMREYLCPYEKRTYSTNWTNQLKTSKWSEWVSGRIDEIESKWQFKEGNFLSVQIQPFGGLNSMFYKNGLSPDTSYSWRDTTIVCVLDNFYMKSSPNHDPRQIALDWQQKNDDEGISGPSPKFCDKDRRLLWGSHGSHIMEEVKDFYYEPLKYARLLAIKRLLDPRSIFSPNTFCVGGAHPNSVSTVPNLVHTPLITSLEEGHLVTQVLQRKKAQLKDAHHPAQHLGLKTSVKSNISSIARDLECMERQKQGVLQQHATDLLKSIDNKASSILKSQPSKAIAPTATDDVVDVFINEADLDVPLVGIVRVFLHSTIQELRAMAEEDEIHLHEGDSFVYHGARLTAKQEGRFKVSECARPDLSRPGKFVIDIVPVRVRLPKAQA